VRETSGGESPPRVLLVGGLEASGRAGLLADAEAVRARGGVPLLVATAVTAQGRGTFEWTAVAPALVAAQIRAVRELGPVHAVKLGMVPGRAHLAAVRRALRGLRIPWVVDPVVRASSAGTLSALIAGDYLGLAVRHVWITPNALEAVWLLHGSNRPRTSEETRAAAERLLAHGFEAVVVKGGHLRGAEVVDVLASRGGVRLLRGLRLPRARKKRGTGCRFASALATELAKGRPPIKAARSARAIVRRYLARR
jgi:hydroxymethylpyrimidine/phosphomethylpyrimidine kinase